MSNKADNPYQKTKSGWLYNGVPIEDLKPKRTSKKRIKSTLVVLGVCNRALTLDEMQKLTDNT